MCMKSSKPATVPEPVKYAQQKTANRQDTADAQSRVTESRNRATKTLLADNVGETDETTKKVLLGG